MSILNALFMKINKCRTVVRYSVLTKMDYGTLHHLIPDQLEPTYTLNLFYTNYWASQPHVPASSTLSHFNRIRHGSLLDAQLAPHHTTCGEEIKYQLQPQPFSELPVHADVAMPPCDSTPSHIPYRFLQTA